MSKATEIKSVLDQVDQATNEVASDLEALRGRITAGLSDTEAEEIKLRLDTLRQRLEVMGQDADNPVPGVEGGTTGGGTI